MYLAFAFLVYVCSIWQRILQAWQFNGFIV